MSQQAIENFPDWYITTREKIQSGPREILQEVVKQTYILGTLSKGKGVAKTFRDGSRITDRLSLTNTGDAGFYQPNQTFTNTIRNNLQSIAVPWRFAHNSWSYTDEELILNGGDELTQWKDLAYAKESSCKLNTFNFMEEAIWAAHSNAEMEVSTGTQPYCLRSFITSDGLAPSGSTTVMGLSPSTYALWRNQVSTYTAATIASTLIPAFDQMWLKVNFTSPGGTIAEQIKDTNPAKFFIWTNLDGLTNYVNITRESNDRLIQQNDPGKGYHTRTGTGGVSFNGISVDYIKGIDAIGYTTGQPPFFWVNSEYLYPIFHTDRYFKFMKPMNSVNQPYSWTVHQSTWYQLWCGSRQRQGIVTV